VTKSLPALYAEDDQNDAFLMTPNELLNTVKSIKDFWLTLNQTPNRLKIAE